MSKAGGGFEGVSESMLHSTIQELDVELQPHNENFTDVGFSGSQH